MIAEVERGASTDLEGEIRQPVAVAGPDVGSLRLRLMTLHAQAAALREEGSDGNDPQYQSRVMAVAEMIANVPGAAEAVFTLPAKVSK